MRREFVSRHVLYVLIALSAMGVMFGSASYARALSAEADAMCNPWYAQCGCNQVPCKSGCCGGKNTNKCPVGICIDTTNNKQTKGICVAANNCQAEAFEKLGGGFGSVGDLKGILDLAQKIKQLLGGGGGGGGSGSAGGGSSSLYPPCVTNPATGTVSPIPCTKSDGTTAYSSTDTNLGGLGGTQNIQGSVADTLLNSLGGGSVSDTLQDAISGSESGGSGSTGSGTSTGTSTSESDTSGSTQGGGDTQVQTSQQGGIPLTPEQIARLQSGNQGNIIVGEDGVTIIVSSGDNGSETVGFYGSTIGGNLQSQSVFGRVCASRPWANSFLSSFVPESVFDGLCRAGGYQVGLIQRINSGASGTQTFTNTEGGGQIQPPLPTNTAAPLVDIWAEPDRVRLGTRTYIFWDSRNVDSCEARGPSFEQYTLSGGASTVPISDTSRFTIVCTAPDGSTVEDSVTVYLAI